MTRKYTDSEVVEKARALSNSPEVIDRSGSQTSEGIVSSLVEFVYRSLNSDVDSIYSLIKLLTSEQVGMCSEVVSKLSELYELAPSVNRGPETLNERSLQQIQRTAEAAYFNQGSLREESLRSLNSQIERFVSEGSSGRAPQYATERCLTLLVESIALVETLQQEASRFKGIVKDYMDADFEAVSVQNSLTRTNEALSLLGNNLSDPNEAKLVLSVAHGLLNSSRDPKRDVTSAKYTGPVTPLPGDRAVLLGTTAPLIIHDQGLRTDLDVDPELEVTLSMTDNTKTISVSAPASDVATINHIIPDAALRRTESGVLLESQSGTPIGGPRYLSSHDREIGAVLLSNLLHESNIEYDPVTKVYSHVNSAAFLPFLKTCVSPNSVVIRYRVGQTDHDSYEDQNEEGTLPIEDFYTTQDVVVTDDGAGSLVDSVGMVVGDISYSKGEIYLESPIDIDPTSAVTITYDYLPLYEGRSYIATSGSPTIDGYFESWDDFSIWVGNTITTTRITNTSDSSVPSTYIESLEDILTTFGRPIRLTRTGNRFSFYGDLGGSSSRVSFPHRESISQNTQPFAPVWLTTPSDYNQALGLTSVSRREAYGRDTLTTQISVSDSDLSVGLSRKPLLPNLIFRATGPGLLDTSDNLDAVEVGDDIHITSPVDCHVKVISKSDSQVEVRPEVPLPITQNDSDALEVDLDIIGSVSRDQYTLSTPSDDPSVLLSVSDDGLGFTGEVRALTTRVLLGNDISMTNAITPFGYNIKPGDTVSENGGDAARPIGVVKSVSGNEVTLSITSDSYTYPYADLSIHSLGWSRYKLCAAPIRRLSEALYNQLYGDEILVKGASYLNSGSGQNGFYQAILTLRDNVAELRNQYLSYDAHVVNTAEGLLTYFRQDKVGAVSELLERCKFSEIADLTPATLSARSSVEQLMSEASNLMGGDMTYWHRDNGLDLTNDYMSRSDHPTGVTRLGSFEDVEEP